MMHLKILSPNGSLADLEIVKIALPGRLGPFMVLNNHAPLIGSLTEGCVRYTRPNGGEEQLAIAGGFVHVLNNNIELCVELRK